MSGLWATYTHDMAHRHVLLGYGFAWLIQLGYLGFVATRARHGIRHSSGHDAGR